MEYKRQYSTMASSKNPQYMMLFGDVMSDMMEWMIVNNPKLAEEMLARLDAINWKQYLTKTEADNIVRNMEPEAPWSYDTWARAMEQAGLEQQREGVWNSYAMWVEMCANYSDHGKTIAQLMGMKPGNVPQEKMLPAIYALSVDMLTDKDGKYNIRKYFKG